MLLYVLAIICHVVGISHHLPPPTKAQDKTDSPYHPSNADDNGADNTAAEDNGTDNNDAYKDAADNDAGNKADNTATKQMTTATQPQMMPQQRR